MIYYTYLRKPNPRWEEPEQEMPQCREDDRIVNDELLVASSITVKSNKQRFTVSIEAGYIEVLRQQAANEGTSIGDIIRRAIATYIEAV